MKQKTKFRVLMLWLLIVLAVTLFGPILAFAAEPEDCNTADSTDLQIYCLALVWRDTSACARIDNQDLRKSCVRQVSK